MPKRNHTALKDELATHIAGGGSVKSFADKHAMSLRTAYSWSASDEVKVLVREHRRRISDAVVGVLTSASVRAVQTLLELLKPGTGEATRLGAARSILDAVARLSNEDLEARITELEKVAAAKPKPHRRIAG